MRRITGTVRTLAAGLAVVALVVVAPWAGASGTGEARADDTGEVLITLAIERVPNAASAAVLEAALLEVRGVRSAEVTYQSRRASVEVDTSRVSTEQLVAAITDISDYEVTVLPPYTGTAAIRVPDLDSREVAHTVNESLSSLPGIVGGTIRSGIIAVDYNTDLVTTQRIVSTIVDATGLSPSEVVIPANDDPPPDRSAQVVIRIPGISGYRDAIEIADRLSVVGIFDAAFDLGTRQMTFIYAIETLTAPMILDVVQRFAGPDIEVVTVDRAGKPVGINVHGWFVVGVSLIGLVAAFLLYVLIRRFRRERVEPE